ncbi:hypothetical protein Cgig2_006407 [Carnegiea gigantea]|uniref:Reverse transcriptase zinc-binding domain-containing protein n=1 Tax=Carnegiea gigantea TaxID=171969 RepID=A0A9Q1GIG4_9CARY|nr:hypothetical protein Cgig2_006407 [Carnegiea gigantea]
MKITSSTFDLIKQQSKAEWISQGDDCTKYFFAKIMHRKAKTFMYAINDDQGQHHTGFHEVAAVLHQYYHKLLGPSNLCKPFSEKDIKDALFSIPNLKSPGPDGYNSGFFKTTWPLLGGLNCDTIHRFFHTGRDYTVKKGYLWLLGDQTNKPWSILTWSRTIIPRHSFTTWLFFQQRVPVKCRLAKLTSQTNDPTCVQRNTAEESQEHLFLSGQWTKELWHLLSNWWPLPSFNPNFEDFLRAFTRLKGPRKKKKITYAVMAAALYHIWRTRNSHIFETKTMPATKVFAIVKEPVIQRVLLLNSLYRRFDNYIEQFLN